MFPRTNTAEVTSLPYSTSCAAAAASPSPAATSRSPRRNRCADATRLRRRYPVRLLLGNGLDGEIHLDASVRDTDGICGHGNHWRERADSAGEDVEPPAVTRALDAVAFQLALTKSPAVVGADVIDDAEPSVLGAAEGKAASLSLDHDDLSGSDIADLRDRD